MLWLWVSLVAIVAVVVYDLVQRRHAILRNFPIIGHFRYILEAVGPELRQYIVTNNDEERPFSRDQRRWIYASSKRDNNYFAFGSDNEMELSASYLVIKHQVFPLNSPHPGEPDYDPHYVIPCAKVMGGSRDRKEGVSAVVDRQHLWDEFRLPERPGPFRRSTRVLHSRIVCKTLEKAVCRSITCAAVISSGRSAPATSVVATSQDDSAWPASRRVSSGTPACGRSRSS